MINELFGGIDIYLFDQISKGRFESCRNVLDVGCGKGRNLVYLNNQGVDVFGIDASSQAVKNTIYTLKNCNEQNFKVAEADEIPYETGYFDAVICNAVLHFAKNDDHFEKIINEIWRVLAPNGILFIRLASSIGIENIITALGNNQYKLPDGSVRYLVTEKKLLEMTNNLNAKLLDPIKTTNVQNLRCMTTLVLKKSFI